MRLICGGSQGGVDVPILLGKFTLIIFVLPVAHSLYAALRVCLLVCLGSTRCSGNSRGFEVGFGVRKSRLV